VPKDLTGVVWALYVGSVAAPAIGSSGASSGEDRGWFIVRLGVHGVAAAFTGWSADGLVAKIARLSVEAAVGGAHGARQAATVDGTGGERMARPTNPSRVGGGMGHIHVGCRKHPGKGVDEKKAVTDDSKRLEPA